MSENAIFDKRDFRHFAPEDLPSVFTHAAKEGTVVVARGENGHFYVFEFPHVPVAVQELIA